MTPRVHTLANGVRVVCDPLPGWQTVALSVVAGRGARFEDAARSGWSHLLEHMVFKGAGGRSARDIVEVIEAEGGHINAATGYERTSFQVRALKDGLDLGSRVLSDLVLRPTMDAQDLAREKQVVGQEIAEAADTPDDLVFELAQEAAFDGQPLGRPILGTPRSIKGATPETLGDWRAALYAPETLIVSAAGAVDEDDLIKLAERDFGAAAGAGVADAPAAAFAGGTRTVAKRLEQANIVLLLPAVGVMDPDYFALRLLAEMLGGGMASRLFERVREEKGLAYFVRSGRVTGLDAGMFYFFAGTQPGKENEVLAEIDAEVARMRAGEIEPVELARCHARLKAARRQSLQTNSARAMQAGLNALQGQPVNDWKNYDGRIEAVTIADLAAFAARHFDAARRMQLVVRP